MWEYVIPTMKGLLHKEVHRH